MPAKKTACSDISGWSQFRPSPALKFAAEHPMSHEPMSLGRPGITLMGVDQQQPDPTLTS
jgi:hypothetical protein